MRSREQAEMHRKTEKRNFRKSYRYYSYYARPSRGRASVDNAWKFTESTAFFLLHDQRTYLVIARKSTASNSYNFLM